MSSIGSVSGINTTAYPRPVVENRYETNSRAFGPVVASAIGAAEAGGAAASSVVSFSSEGLQKLGEALESGYDAVSDGVSTVANGIANLAHEGAAAVEGAYDSVVDGVGNAASSVGDTVGSALGTVGQYAALGMAAGRQLISEIA